MSNSNDLKFTRGCLTVVDDTLSEEKLQVYLTEINLCKHFTSKVGNMDLSSFISTFVRQSIAIWRMSLKIEYDVSLRITKYHNYRHATDGRTIVLFLHRMKQAKSWRMDGPWTSVYSLCWLSWFILKFINDVVRECINHRSFERTKKRFYNVSSSPNLINITDLPLNRSRCK